MVHRPFVIPENIHILRDYLEDEFHRFFRRWRDEPETRTLDYPRLREVELHQDMMRDQMRVQLEFEDPDRRLVTLQCFRGRGAPCIGFSVPRELLSEVFRPHGFNMAHADSLREAIRDLWWRKYEDMRARVEVDAASALLHEMQRQGVDPDAIHRMQVHVNNLEANHRAHHRRRDVDRTLPRMPDAPTPPYGRSPAMTALETINQANAATGRLNEMQALVQAGIAAGFSARDVERFMDRGEPARTERELRNQHRNEMVQREAREVYERYDYMRGIRDERGAANRRAKELLEAALSKKQLAQWKAMQAFDVVGSDTGYRYRIHYASSGGVHQFSEKHGDGKLTGRWCFLPTGGLVIEDIMLAQKIALETEENKAIMIANAVGWHGDKAERVRRFKLDVKKKTTDSMFDEIRMYPGAVNYVRRDDEDNWRWMT